jgi:serine/threonine protein kinase
MALLSQGEKVKGRASTFVIERSLSPGSLGAIFLARDSDGRSVVIKMPRVQGDDLDRARRDRVKLETDILRSMKEKQETSKIDEDGGSSVSGYQHICHYVDDGVYQGYPFLVTEFLAGGRVREVYSFKPATIPTAIRSLEQLLSVADFLHGEGVVHRDINPSNIILEPVRDLVLIDFGVAKWKDSSYPEVRAGTRLYSAPEQFESPERAAETSDLFAVASTTFYMLSARDPPEITRQTEDVGKLLTKISGDVPSVFLPFFEIAMNPDPAKRFGSAKSMLDEIHRVKQRVRYFTLVMGNKSYDIFGTVDIGKAHICDRACEENGFDHALSVLVDDPKNFISRHHCRVEVTRDEVLLYDLGSTNGTAVRRKGESEFSFLGNRKNPQKTGFKLEPGDQIALAFDQKIGPYRIAEFRKRGDSS